MALKTWLSASTHTRVITGDRVQSQGTALPPEGTAGLPPPPCILRSVFVQLHFLEEIRSISVMK